MTEELRNMNKKLFTQEPQKNWFVPEEEFNIRCTAHILSIIRKAILKLLQDYNQQARDFFILFKYKEKNMEECRVLCTYALGDVSFASLPSLDVPHC
eukprot:snap_masked-scaffold_3-processed-gene-1.22-mRNA-1 protein AED:1.00 eAED:1.00 QI:0/-1/0/0/-1/1/1/0/96